MSHSVLTSKTLNRPKNQHVFLDLQEQGGTQGKPTAPRLEKPAGKCRKSYFRGAEAQGETSAETSAGSGGAVEKPQS